MIIKQLQVNSVSPRMFEYALTGWSQIYKCFMFRCWRTVHKNDIAHYCGCLKAFPGKKAFLDFLLIKLLWNYALTKTTLRICPECFHLVFTCFSSSEILILTNTETLDKLVHRNITEKVNNIPYPTAFPYGNGMVLHFYHQQESSTTKTVHKVINKRLKA